MPHQSFADWHQTVQLTAPFTASHLIYSNFFRWIEAFNNIGMLLMAADAKRLKATHRSSSPRKGRSQRKPNEGAVEQQDAQRHIALLVEPIAEAVLTDMRSGVDSPLLMVVVPQQLPAIVDDDDGRDALVARAPLLHELREDEELLTTAEALSEQEDASVAEAKAIPNDIYEEYGGQEEEKRVLVVGQEEEEREEGGEGLDGYCTRWTWTNSLLRLLPSRTLPRCVSTRTTPSKWTATMSRWGCCHYQPHQHWKQKQARGKEKQRKPWRRGTY